MGYQRAWEPAAGWMLVAMLLQGCATAPVTPTFKASLALPSAAGPSRESQRILTERIAPMAERVIDEGWAKGLAIGVLTPTGSAVMGFGSTGTSAEEIPTADSRFEIASITKTFTSLLLAQAVVAGKTTLDTPLADILPRTPQAPAGRPIVLQDLATHHSGLPRLPMDWAPGTPSNPYADYSLDDLDHVLAYQPLDAPPGTQFAYSNLGAATLGRALETLEGVPYGELLRMRILEPLGMNASWLPPPQGGRDDLVPGHAGDGSLRHRWTFDAFAPTGGVVSTVHDMLRYLHAHLHPTKPMRLAMKEHVDRPSGAIGLGWHVGFGVPGTERVRWHNGQTGGFHSCAALDLETGSAIVVLSNTASLWLDTLCVAGMGALAGTEIPFGLPKSIPIPTDELARYVGTFRTDTGVEASFSRVHDALVIKTPGQPAHVLWPLKPNAFFLKSTFGFVFFRASNPDSDSRMDAVLINIHGARLEATRE